MNSSDIEYLIVDWGTTNFRAFALDAKGNLVSEKASKLGLMQVQDQQFDQALESVLKPWLDNYTQLPIYMAGMVGSAQGWKNVDYVQAPASLPELAKQAHQFELPWGAKAYIIPGVSYQNAADIYDVMRGEEVQLFGLADALKTPEFVAVFPGTHSKHIRYQNGRIADFASFMTGEVFSLLFQNSILGKNLPEQKDDQATFMKGVIESQTNCLTNRIFAARTHRLFAQVKDEHISEYLSGLLIGYEIRQLNGHHVYLVGGESLCQRYQLASETLSKEASLHSGDECFLAGMHKIIEEIQSEH